jgi:TonB family protein
MVAERGLKIDLSFVVLPGAFGYARLMRALLVTGIVVCMASSSLLAGPKADSLEVRKNVVHMVSPQYPHKLGRSRIGGTGVFRMTIDPKTGKVVDVAVVKSTGQDALDREARIALRQWRFKPGNLTTADQQITFQASGPVDVPSVTR